MIFASWQVCVVLAVAALGGVLAYALWMKDEGADPDDEKDWEL